MDRLPNFVYLGFRRKGAGRTDTRTLTAVHTLYLVKVFTEAGDYHSLCAPIRKINSPDRLDFRTHTDAVTAENTFIRITYNRR